MGNQRGASAGRRLEVVGHALRLFADQGYEATSVDEIAEAAGISRRTFFRRFRSKEDVVFADHETLLAQVAEYLAKPSDDPRAAVCEAALLVFDHFAAVREIAYRRYEVLREIPALREREIVMTFRYQRQFVDYLRERLPEAPDLDHVQFAAALIGTHNYLLRRMVRGATGVTPEQARTALADLRRRFAA
ncbi:MAG: TetR family transcriptional regulator [Mycobacteriaceae bacterium]|nr:TetR family transcriptional regulator [Mycobacteriaceae bacterium]